MPRRSILTARQRAALIDLPKDEASILYHYTLSDEDIEHINQNWPGVLRSAATMVTGGMPPSQLLKKFAAYWSCGFDERPA